MTRSELLTLCKDVAMSALDDAPGALYRLLEPLYFPRIDPERFSLEKPRHPTPPRAPSEPRPAVRPVTRPGVSGECVGCRAQGGNPPYGMWRRLWEALDRADQVLAFEGQARDEAMDRLRRSMGCLRREDRSFVARGADADWKAAAPDQGSYRVLWDVDVVAKSHTDAAQAALEMLRDPNSAVTVFTVENGTDPHQVVDLGKDLA